MSQTIYTIGHSRRTNEELLGILHHAGITQLIDVRAYPRSARHSWFNDTALRPTLAQAGVSYRWLGRELGGLRDPHPDSHHLALRLGGLRGFADYMETPEFFRGIALLAEATVRIPSVIMCTEATPSECHRGMIADFLTVQCHRGMIADFLTVHGIEVIHLLGIGEKQTHRLHPAARNENGRLVYDRTGQRGLALD